MSMTSPKQEIPLLVMEGISKSFPGVQALKNVRFDLRAGEVHALLGENGAGKSTLIKILCGAYRKDSGHIRLEGRDLDVNNPADARRYGIGTIHQELMLVPDLSVAENIFLGREPVRARGRIDWKVMHQEARRVLEELCVSIDPYQPVRTLSVAQKQLVEIAKALSQNLRVLVMDEPTSALTEQETAHLMDRIMLLKEKGIGILYISHRLEEIMSIADRATILRDGEYIGTLEKGEISSNRIIEMMVGRQNVYHRWSGQRKIGEPVLEVQHLTTPIVKDVSFTLHKGEILGIAGLMGSGRTETVRAIFGIDPRLSGRIVLQGREISVKHPQKAISAGMGFAPEDRKDQALFLGMSVRTNVNIARLFLNRWGLRRLTEERQVAQSYIESLDIRTPHLEQETLFLSGGNQQKVVIARWLSTNPQVLILDEPTRGIDVSAKGEIHELMAQLAAKGMAILIVSSELPELLTVCDRILVMREGQVAGTLMACSTTQAEIMAYATGQLTGGGAGETRN